MITANDVLKLIMRRTFEATEDMGGYQSYTPPPTSAYARALAEQKAKKGD